MTKGLKLLVSTSTKLLNIVYIKQKKTFCQFWFQVQHYSYSNLQTRLLKNTYSDKTIIDYFILNKIIHVSRLCLLFCVFDPHNPPANRLFSHQISSFRFLIFKNKNLIWKLGWMFFYKTRSYLLFPLRPSTRVDELPDFGDLELWDSF